MRVTSTTVVTHDVLDASLETDATIYISLSRMISSISFYLGSRSPSVRPSPRRLCHRTSNVATRACRRHTHTHTFSPSLSALFPLARSVLVIFSPQPRLVSAWGTIDHLAFPPLVRSRAHRLKPMPLRLPLACSWPFGNGDPQLLLHTLLDLWNAGLVLFILAYPSLTNSRVTFPSAPHCDTWTFFF